MDQEPMNWPAAFLYAVIVLAGLFDFRGVFSDLNQWMKGRQGRFMARAQSLCPHVHAVESGDGRTVLIPAFLSPSGTVMWLCERCKQTTYNPSPWERDIYVLLENPGFGGREKRFNKALSEIQ